MIDRAPFGATGHESSRVIFGAAATGNDSGSALKLEAAVALFIVAGAPFVTGAAIRAART